MRQLGTLPDAAQATRFTDYLVAKGIFAQSEPAGERFTVWVRLEDQFPQAKQEFEKYLADPSNERYDDNSAAAEEVRRQRQEKLDAARENVVDARNLWTQPALHQIPATVTLLALCLAVSVATNFGGQFVIFDENSSASIMNWLTFFRMDRVLWALVWRGFDPLVDVKEGEVWRLITPIFLHFGVMHFVLNSIWAYQLGGQIEQKHGSTFLVMLSLFAAIGSNVGQELLQVSLLGGFSGVVYSYFGYIWIRPMLQPSINYAMASQNVFLMLAWLVFGFSGLAESMFGMKMANWAHLFGMVAGGVVAVAHAMWKRSQA